MMAAIEAVAVRCGEDFPAIAEVLLEAYVLSCCATGNADALLASAVTSIEAARRALGPLLLGAPDTGGEN